MIREHIRRAMETIKVVPWLFSRDPAKIIRCTCQTCPIHGKESRS